MRLCLRQSWAWTGHLAGTGTGSGMRLSTGLIDMVLDMGRYLGMDLGIELGMGISMGLWMKTNVLLHLEKEGFNSEVHIFLYT